MDINLDELDITNRTALEIQIAEKTGQQNNTALIEFILRLLNGSVPVFPGNATVVNSTTEFDDDASINLIEGTILDVYIACIIITSIIGILGNLTVLAVSFHSSKRLNNCRFLVAHLAFCDVLFSVMQLFRVGPHFSTDSKWTLGTGGCKIVRGSILLGSLVAVSTILIIALERYRGIVMTLSGRIRRRYLIMAVVCAWIVSVIIVLPPLIFLTVNPETGQCEEDWDSAPDWASKTYTMLLLVAFFLLPLAIMVFLYGSMIRLLSQPLTSKTRIGGKIDDYYVKRRRKEDLRVVKILVMVVVMFAICVLPIRLFWVIMEFVDGLSLQTYKTLFFIGLLPYPFHVAVNPLIYGVVDFKFRKRVRRLLQSLGKRISYRCTGESEVFGPSTREASLATSTEMKASHRSPYISSKHGIDSEMDSAVKPYLEITDIDIKPTSDDGEISKKSSYNDSDTDIKPYIDDDNDFVIKSSTADLSVTSQQSDNDSGIRSLHFDATGMVNAGMCLEEDSIDV